MGIWEKIAAILMAPFTGVYLILDEYIDNRIVKLILYFLWCVAFGWFFALGAMLTYLLIYSKIHSKDEE